MPSLTEQIDRALSDGKLRADAAENIRRILSGEESDFAARVIGELSQANEWEELNDRFYKTLAFGTGGLRGRTIGKIVTPSERGTPTALGRPEFPCVGTNAMNYFNVGRATRGLVIYIQKWRSGQRLEGRAKIVIAHDTRHFSQEFTRLAAETASANGCDAVVFDGPRSTPELSFAVRYLNADAGIVITASHNPPHDNGYKVYFNDGAQVVEPHASGIIAEVNEPSGGTGPAHPKSSGDASVRQKVEISSGQEIDRAYMERLETLILDRGLIERTRDLKIVYTPIHGTGGVIVKPMLRKIGLNFSVVPEQDQFDGRFPTVKSPNPENAEALNLGISLAQKQNADLVIATDPDCDRMGVAVRTSSGEMKLPDPRLGPDADPRALPPGRGKCPDLRRSSPHPIGRDLRRRRLSSRRSGAPRRAWTSSSRRPGRLLDHVGQRDDDLVDVEVLVLDEADRMLDMGFSATSPVLDAAPRRPPEPAVLGDVLQRSGRSRRRSCTTRYGPGRAAEHADGPRHAGAIPVDAAKRELLAHILLSAASSRRSCSPGRSTARTASPTARAAKASPRPRSTATRARRARRALDDFKAGRARPRRDRRRGARTRHRRRSLTWSTTSCRRSPRDSKCQRTSRCT